MDGTEPVVSELLRRLEIGGQEPFGLTDEGLAAIDARLQELRGRPGLAQAIEGLAQFAGYFAESGAPRLSRTLLSLIETCAGDLRALRMRLCGQSKTEQDAGRRLARFAGAALALAPPTNHAPRDFRIALLSGTRRD